MVLGCAGLVAAHPGALVVTVTAGKPPPHPLTDWDRKCGFAEGDDIVGERRKEDEAALKDLGARPLWLDFLDHQYRDGKPPPEGDVAREIEFLLRDRAPDIVATPLGLSHPDHLATAAACLDVMRRMPGVTWMIYEDAIYRAGDSLSSQAMRHLSAVGFVPESIPFPDAGGKQAAIARYTSQVIGLGDLLQDAFAPEHYWNVAARR